MTTTKKTMCQLYCVFEINSVKHLTNEFTNIMGVLCWWLIFQNMTERNTFDVQLYMNSLYMEFLYQKGEKQDKTTFKFSNYSLCSLIISCKIKIKIKGVISQWFHSRNIFGPTRTLMVLEKSKEHY